jgi:hypothetical protein
MSAEESLESIEKFVKRVAGTLDGTLVTQAVVNAVIDKIRSSHRREPTEAEVRFMLNGGMAGALKRYDERGS